MTFKDLGLKESILESISKLGFETPSPIQEQVIPYLLNNDSDIVGLAQTGTGKTAAFGLPLIHLAEPKEKYIQGLVLAPTRDEPHKIHAWTSWAARRHRQFLFVPARSVRQ